MLKKTMLNRKGFGPISFNQFFFQKGCKNRTTISSSSSSIYKYILFFCVKSLPGGCSRFTQTESLICNIPNMFPRWLQSAYIRLQIIAGEGRSLIWAVLIWTNIKNLPWMHESYKKPDFNTWFDTLHYYILILNVTTQDNCVTQQFGRVLVLLS